MSLEFQPMAALQHLGFFACEETEAYGEAENDADLPDKPEVTFKAGNKEYKLSENASSSSLAKQVKQYLSEKGFTKSSAQSLNQTSPSFSNARLPSPFSPTVSQGKQSFEAFASSRRGNGATSSKENTSKPLLERQAFSASKDPLKHLSQKKESTTRQERNREGNGRFSSLLSKNWSKQDTYEFWHTRYHKKDKEQGHHQQDQGRQQEEQEKREKKNLVERIKKAIFDTRNGNPQNQNETPKPVLERPKTGVFALYYILTKIGIFSDGSSNSAYKKEIEFVDEESTTAHKKRLEEMKKAIDKENSSRRWSIAEKVFSWMGSLFAMIAGAVLIATGVGAVAGAMMIAAGVIQITNQILEISGGWKKIAELLPGDDLEKKRAVVSWIQLGIAVLCIILSGAGIIFGGYSTFGEAMQQASNMIGAVATMGHGATSIGQGISSYKYKDAFGEVKRHEKRLAELKHMREDLMDKVEMGVDRLEQLFEDLSKAIEFEVELFRADQMINRG